jgi:OOP family OmpA-OmpF porin
VHGRFFSQGEVEEDFEMKKKFFPFILLSGICLFFLAGWCPAQEEDAEGCKDYPVFSRLKNFYISSCESNFDAVEFTVGEGETKTIEGQKTVINYSLKEGIKAPSDLQIKRNYSNAMKSLGGSIIYESDLYVSLKLVKNGKEIWAAIETYNGATLYVLTVVEAGAMAQEVSANDMLDALNKDGFMALYINFDTGKATIKPESQPIIEQIGDLLKNNPDLKLNVEGHTDNAGTAPGNKILSDERAKAVVTAVVSKGIDASRLTAVGWGQEKPIADNRTEEGRAKNRRVEIVKK